jgi:uncharacterized protein (DUF58 family)
VLRDRRPYAPGDDPRAIDWPAYARLGRLFVKLVEPEEPRDALVLLDVSASMGAPARKLGLARRVAAAAAVVALARPARCGVAAFADRLVDMVEPRAGKGASARSLAFLEGVRAAGDGGGAPLRAFEEAARRLLRRTHAVIVTDALWPGDVAAPLARLAHAGHAVALVRVDDPADRAPRLEGALALVSAEGGARLDVDAGPALLDAYAEAARAHAAAVAHACRRAGAALVEAPTDAPVEEALLDLVAEGVLPGA